MPARLTKSHAKRCSGILEKESIVQLLLPLLRAQSWHARYLLIWRAVQIYAAPFPTGLCSTSTGGPRMPSTCSGGLRHWGTTIALLLIVIVFGAFLVRSFQYEG